MDAKKDEEHTSVVLEKKDSSSNFHKKKGRRKKQSGFSKFINKCLRRPPQEEDDYELYLNDSVENAHYGYPTNFIKTSKYTVLNFIPKNLYEQFRRVSNIYFAAIIVPQFFPEVSPFTPVTSILPLAFVLIVTAIKEAIEDFYRHRDDNKNNSAKFQVIRDTVVTIPSEKIRAGDIVIVENMRQFPADLILLSSSNEDGNCFVQTANLDGETNLKQRQGLRATSKCKDEESLAELKGFLKFEPPNAKLYQFHGVLHLSDTESYALSLDQFLHRGAQLRNSEKIYGLCVYAGSDTKLFMNQKKPPSKFSTLEKQLNKILIGIFLFQFFLCTANAILAGWFDGKYSAIEIYVGVNPYNGPLYGFLSWWTFLLIYNRMIPISLWVTMEIAKVCQAKFMEWDENFALDPSNLTETGMRAKTSSINEDLGRIQQIFSDKTGTLTENIMKFAKCSIGTSTFDIQQAPTVLLDVMKDETTPPELKKSIRDFLLLMALCNNVVPEKKSNKDNIGEKKKKKFKVKNIFKKDKKEKKGKEEAKTESIEVKEEEEKSGELTYQAESPDEKSLVETAAENGFRLLSRGSDEIVLSIEGKEEKFKILVLMEFTSARRRMSAIFQNSNNEIILYSKGADVTIFERLKNTKENVLLKDTMAQHLGMYSKEGLRTLAVGIRKLSQAEFDEWYKGYHHAITSLRNREELVEKSCDKIERELDLLGCTAIEDKLQEEVPETIDYLLKAGIMIWVLTGDKQETAINIGYSSKLLQPETKLIILNASNREDLEKILNSNISKYVKSEGIQLSDLEIENSTTNYAIVVDGFTLEYALKHYVDKFLQLTKLCRSVICCRVTPLQKSLVVRTVKKKEGKITLAVGDGANDVSMIQEAHCGVGIFGKEGRQAAMASDYAIHKFKHLKRLICVHGRYSQLRIAGMVLYFFYKNMTYALSTFLYTFYNGHSGQSFYDPWVITFYNVILTAAPPFIYGVFERDVNDDIIYKHPELYRRGQSGALFTPLKFALWMLSACWHALVVFFSCVFVWNNEVLSPNGKTADFWVMSTYGSTLLVFIVLFRIAVATRTWNWFVHLAIWGSMVSYAAFMSAYSIFNSIDPSNMYYIFYYTVSTPPFYFMILISCAIALLPEVLVRIGRAIWAPNDYEILQERYRLKLED